jgi:hypothetical protein
LIISLYTLNFMSNPDQLNMNAKFYIESHPNQLHDGHWTIKSINYDTDEIFIV